MNILIINGSPKGDSSITLQTVNYLQKLFPDHTYDIIYAGQQIKSIEKDFLPSRKKLAKAELVIFCYPVYKYLVPLSGSLAERFRRVDFSLIDLLGSFNDVNQLTAYISELFRSGSATDSTDSPTNPNAHTTEQNGGLSGFAKLIAALKSFFEAIANFFKKLFGMK